MTHACMHIYVVIALTFNNHKHDPGQMLVFTENEQKGNL